MKKLIIDDLVKIKRSNYFSGLFSFIFDANDNIVLTTDRYHDYVVQHNIDSVIGLNYKYKVVEMLEDFDGEAEDRDKELWDQDTRSYREWKIKVI